MTANWGGGRRPDGYIERGAQVTRLEAFVDAAFAFALTLLVVSIDAVPTNRAELIDALKGVPAFAASFAMLGWFWFGHVQWSRRFGLDDAMSTVASLLLVFLVLVFVYPLKVLFSSFLAWASGGALPAVMEVQSYGDVALVFVVYGAAFASLSLLLAFLYWHALRRAALLQLDHGEISATRGHLASWLFAASVALVSIVLALLLPDDPGLAGSLPGALYCLLGASGLVYASQQPRRST